MSTAVEFDFKQKLCRPIRPADVPASCAAGQSCWVDLDTTDSPAAERLLLQLGVDELAISRVLAAAEENRYESYDACLHVSLAAVDVFQHHLVRSKLDLILGERFVITLHRGRFDAIDRVQEIYEKDFARFAQTISFIVFEVFDHLTDGYRRAIRELEREVESFPSTLFGPVDDSIFVHCGHATRKLLGFRSVLNTSRDVLGQLVTRKSEFVNESTRPYLEAVASAQEGLADDLTVAREVLAEALDLYMGIVSHRTNRVVSRLTAVSVIFMPLTFLCGVYGMNFHHIPELSWRYSYPVFWGVVLMIAGGLILFMKRQRWI